MSDPTLSELCELPESNLLFWMSHRGEMTRPTLKQGIRAVYPNVTEDKISTKVNTYRRRLFELGHAKPVNGTLNRWEILPPYLVLLPEAVGDENTGLLCGGRTPDFLLRVWDAADQNAIQTDFDPLNTAPPRFSFSGERNALTKFAAALAIPLIDNAPRRMLQQNEPWRQTLQKAPIEREPANSECEHWDWVKMKWILRLPQEKREGDLLKVTVGYGVKPFLVYDGNNWRNVASEAIAKMLSAALQDQKIVRYHNDSQTMIFATQPPSLASRPLCLCSGFPAENNKRSNKHYPYVYESVSPVIADEWAAAFGLTLTRETN